VAVIGRELAVIGAYTPPGARYSLLAWLPAACPFPDNCLITITDTATLATRTVRSPLPGGFAVGGAFSPDGRQLAVFPQTAPRHAAPGSARLAIISLATAAYLWLATALQRVQVLARWLRTAQGLRMAYTASDIGTARAWCAARRTTKPCRPSSSMRRPATRSSCREEKLPGSTACANAKARSWAACGTGLPSASATAHTSATKRLKAAQATSTLRISPIGSRTAAVMPACAQMKASLPHSTVLMLADNSASKPACSHQASSRCALRLVRPSSSPNVMLAGPPLCTITPGSATPDRKILCLGWAGGSAGGAGFLGPP
jgi:hypothetical protein